MELQQKPYLFRGMDGYAGFRHGQAYALTPDTWDDGSGTVTVELPYAPPAGRGRLTPSNGLSGGRRRIRWPLTSSQS
ncbi:MAG TPA: hypothetical protein VF690_11055 [Hymenobacter sp.]|jgi:hypothetical protein